jgi:tRNA uridine 5-carboxymethylaminomethyl modification enzyme
LLDGLTITPNEAQKGGLVLNADGRRRTAFELLSHPGVDGARLRNLWADVGDLEPAILDQLAADAKYSSYVIRQDADIAALRRDEAIEIPNEFSFSGMPGLTVELRQKLEARRPATLAHAAQIDGMTPAALLLIRARLRHERRAKSA